MALSILPGGTDEALAKRLQTILRRRGMAIQTGAAVERIEKVGGALRVVTTGAGGEAAYEGERVLIAPGRWPNTQAMGFDQVGALERPRHRCR
jgi:pyruvate/2-oxoglutarate dehydrogenase complex dihydrolipoamide dehydrogenase (E3) component